MATNEERMRVLKMVEAGKVSPEEAAKLLTALTDAARVKQDARAAASGPQGMAARVAEAARARAAAATVSADAARARGRQLRVRVTSGSGGKSRTNVNVIVPLSAAGFIAKLIDKFVPEHEREGISIHEIVEAVKSGVTGKIVDVVDDDEHVEISIE